LELAAIIILHNTLPSVPTPLGHTHRHLNKTIGQPKQKIERGSPL